MSSSGKSGGQSTATYDYFGTIAGLICLGPLDGLREVLVDSKTIWSDEDGLPAPTEPFTEIQPSDPMFLQPQGYIRIYWGGPDQVSDPNLGVHPPLKGFAYVVFHRFLFGRERTPAPNIEVIGWRIPRVDVSMVPATSNILFDGRINPVAFIAELLTSKIGLELPLTMFDLPAWQAAAAYVIGDPGRTERMFCSPLLTDTSDVRAVIAPLLELLEMTMSWNAAGQLTITLMRLGEVPAGVPVIDADTLTQRVDVSSAGWASVPTGIDVRYTDRDRKFKQAGQKIDNIRVRQLRGEPDRKSVDMPFVTLASQAAAIASRLLVRSGRPPCQIQVQVRSARADTMLVGSKVFVDVDPEPSLDVIPPTGDDELIQLGIVTERREPRDGPVQLTVEADTLVEAIPYAPSRAPAPGTTPITPPILHATIIPLNPSWWGLDAAVGILATRSQGDMIGMHLYFAQEGVSDWARLPDQPGFATCVQLTADIQITDTVLPLQLIDPLENAATTSGYDNYLAGQTPDNQADAVNNHLLLVLAEIEAPEGRVKMEEGLPVLEICSVISRAAIASPPGPANSHNYTVYRSRLDTQARSTAVDEATANRSWQAGTRGWILPLVNLKPTTHELIDSLPRDTGIGHIRIIGFSRAAEDVTDPIPERTFSLPLRYDTRPKIVWTSPATNPSTAPVSGSVLVAFTVTDPGSDLVRLSVVSRHEDDAPVTQFDQTFPQTAQWSYSQTLTLGGVGDHILQVSARDSGGNETINLWTVTVPPASGGGAGSGIVFDPPSGSFWNRLVVHITVDSRFVGIAWKITDPRPTVPTSPFNPAGTRSLDLAVDKTSYIWIAGLEEGGHASGPVVFASYVRL